MSSSTPGQISTSSSDFKPIFDAALSESIMWISLVVNVLYRPSGTLGGVAGMAFHRVGVTFTGIGVLLAAAKYVRTSHDALVELFERVESCFKRLSIYCVDHQNGGGVCGDGSEANANGASYWGKIDVVWLLLEPRESTNVEASTAATRVCARERHTLALGLVRWTWIPRRWCPYWLAITVLGHGADVNSKRPQAS
ncbi:hypothetical protein H4582DRAFT_2061536 [Lactarius indigo]|nr:hypothetical protein H4582DRAFT_2061536 [Lactarius indigo]